MRSRRITVTFLCSDRIQSGRPVSSTPHPRGLMSRFLYAAALSSSIMLSPAHAQSPFTPAPLGEDILQKVRDWQVAPNPQPPTEFRAGHVTPRKLGKDALQAKPGGFEVTLPSGAPVTTPTVYDAKVFSSGGFKSKEFYAVDAKTGQLIWGLDLDDDGRPRPPATRAAALSTPSRARSSWSTRTPASRCGRSGSATLWTSAPAIADGGSRGGAGLARREKFTGLR